jgi:hypothetical protein
VPCGVTATQHAGGAKKAWEKRKVVILLLAIAFYLVAYRGHLVGWRTVWEISRY